MDGMRDYMYFRRGEIREYSDEMTEKRKGRKRHHRKEF